MKHLFYCLLILIVSVRAEAQFHFERDPSYEVIIGYGGVPTWQLFDLPTTSMYKDKYYSGALFISGRHYVRKRASLAFSFTFENETGQWGADNWGTFKRRVFTLGSEFSFEYSRHFYCNFGLAYAYVSELHTHDSANYYNVFNYQNGTNYMDKSPQAVENRSAWNVYVSPIGFRTGGQFGGFIQLGAGYKGFVCVGLYCRFYKDEKL